MSELHLDSSVRIHNQRCAAIIISNNKILMMHRIKHKAEFYVFIGGHRRVDEDLSEVLKREVQEESSLEVQSSQLVFEFHDHKNDNTDYYFEVQVSDGIPELGGEEKLKNSSENFYELIWVELEMFEKLDVKPSFAKAWVLKNYINLN